MNRTREQLFVVGSALVMTDAVVFSRTWWYCFCLWRSNDNSCEYNADGCCCRGVKKPSPGSSQLVFIPLVPPLRCYSLERLHPLVAVCSSGMSLTRSRSCIFINAGVVKKFPLLITSKPDFTLTRHCRCRRSHIKQKSWTTSRWGCFWDCTVVNDEYFPTLCLESVNTPHENISHMLFEEKLITWRWLQRDEIFHLKLCDV